MQVAQGVDTQSKVPNEQQQKTSATDKGTGDNDEEDDDENDFEEEAGINDDDSDDNDESDDERTESESDVIPDPNKTYEEHNEEEEEYDDDEFNLVEDENIDEEEEDEVTKELYDDVNVNLGNDDTKMINADKVLDAQKTGGPTQSSSVSSDFTSKLLNLDNPSLADNEVASLLFNERVTNLEKYLSEIKQFDQYAQALFSIPAIVDRYIDNKLGEAINKAIQAHNFDCREEAQAEKKEYIELVDLTVMSIIKEEVNTQLPQILPQAISDVATPVIEKNVTKSLEAAVLTRSSS
uniref:Uncharacterized protein n=1 Tax=Tanacetum cinerariifolium TaxID=118510 RepID=A0A6L2NMA0_TANCI|nr:hypothetical protein [Tanacetum cinerariifolium]